VRPFEHPAKARRGGCLGCLTQSALALLFGGALMYGLVALLAPWNFYFGGHFHLVPGWTGRGWIHSARSGGDFYLWVHFEPTTPGYRKSPIQGTAFLCTPRGEKFRLHFGGDMPRTHNTDLRGVPIHLYLYNWPLLAQFVHDRRPAFDLYGTFGDSHLIVEDRGSLSRAFRPDGNLVGPGDRDWPWKQESTHVTLNEEKSFWAFSPACPAAMK
jgi:hypothetical protein